MAGPTDVDIVTFAVVVRRTLAQLEALQPAVTPTPSPYGDSIEHAARLVRPAIATAHEAVLRLATAVEASPEYRARRMRG